ncbi:hypothetical protein LEMLEM_LOCUS22778 [Lemmus lemmus]
MIKCGLAQNSQVCLARKLGIAPGHLRVTSLPSILRMAWACCSDLSKVPWLLVIGFRSLSKYTPATLRG